MATSVPHWPAPKVQGHGGELVIWRIGGARVAGRPAKGARFAPSCEGFGRDDVVPTLRPGTADDATVPLGIDPDAEEEEGSA